MTLSDWEEALFAMQAAIDEAIHHPHTTQERKAWLLRAYQHTIEVRSSLRKAGEGLCRPTR